MAVRDLVRATRVRAERIVESEHMARSVSFGPYNDRDLAEIVPYLDTRTTSRSRAGSFESNPLIFGPVWKIAMRMGSLPIKVYTLGAGGVRNEDNDHPAYQLLRKPNDRLTRNLLVAHTVVDLFSDHARAAWLKVRDENGRPIELWPLYGAMVRPVHDPRSLFSGFVITTAKGRRIPLRFEDVCYFRLLPKSGSLADGVSPFTALSEVAGLGQTAISSAVDMFDNALLGRLSATVKTTLKTPAFNRLRKQLEAMRRDKFSIPLLEEGMELKDHPGPSDEVVINAMREARMMIRDALSLPEDDNSTAFYKNTIQPIADGIEQELERSLMPEFPNRPGFPEFAFRDELRGDPKERAELHQTRILSGQETLDEARRDENRPPLPNGIGDRVFIPLNLVPADDASALDEPRAKDSGGGLGGDEGKGTLAAASAQPGAVGALATEVAVGTFEAALREADQRATHLRARKKNWGTLRNRVIQRYAQAMARKVRQVVNKEAKSVKAALSDGRSARAEGGSFPSIKELKRLIARSDKEIAKILEQFMRQTGDASAPEAAGLLDHELSDDALDRLQDVYQERAVAVAGHFAERRADRIIGLVETAVEKGTTTRDLAGQIGEAYSSLSTTYTDGIARTEVAFAHEQAALVTWADAGVRQIEVVFGGGDCTTGICEENADGSPYRLGESMGNVGVSFEGADAPPFHPGCTCFAVPFIEED